MNHLPKLSLGTQRTAGGTGAKSGRGGIAAQLEWPWYGKYCGPGYGDASGCTPVDEVDAACCRHDRCVKESFLGYLDCGCHCDLVKSMPEAILNTPSAEGKAKGALIMGLLASVCPCFDPIWR